MNEISKINRVDYTLPIEKRVQRLANEIKRKAEKLDKRLKTFRDELREGIYA